MAEVKNITKPGLGRLLIYYGWPGEINQTQFSTDPLSRAAQSFTSYDYVVLGAGLELRTHVNHDLTESILAHPLHRETCFFGYVDLGVTTSGFTLIEIRKRIKQWAAMGVCGIFLDDFGYDFQVTRTRQNKAVELAHKHGLPVIACGWEPDHLFAATPDPLFNPKGESPHLGATDFYLYESYQIMNSNYVQATLWRQKARKLQQYRKQWGFQVLAVTTNDTLHIHDSPEPYSQEKFFYAWYSALLDGWAGIGWGEPSYSADSTAPYRQRPDCDPVPGFITSLEEENNLFFRDTPTSRIWVNPATRQTGTSALQRP